MKNGIQADDVDDDGNADGMDEVLDEDDLEDATELLKGSEIVC